MLRGLGLQGEGGEVEGDGVFVQPGGLERGLLGGGGGRGAFVAHFFLFNGAEIIVGFVSEERPLDELFQGGQEGPRAQAFPNNK